MIKGKTLEIFCGTGGVGKTTLATSRAVFLAGQKQKVLLITIDPSRRLKEILNLSEKNAGNPETVEFEGVSFSAELMSPSETFKKIKSYKKEDLNNPILKTLTKPFGGMNEILALVEVDFHLKSEKFDTIILDTPPGNHFIDFLESSKKIKNFFKKTYLDIFLFLESNKKNKTPKLLSILVGSGIQKLLDLMDKITGKTFVSKFIESVNIVYQNRQTFLDALEIQVFLKDSRKSNWFLITSVDHNKMDEASLIKQKASPFMHKDNYFLVNKCWSSYLNSWKPSSKLAKDLKKSLKERESDAIDFAAKTNINVLKFSEVFDLRTHEQVKKLSMQWEK
ncbi:MAG: ArsA-related P-loop ATPase [Bacteriovoracales bacterium]